MKKELKYYCNCKGAWNKPQDNWGRKVKLTKANAQGICIYCNHYAMLSNYKYHSERKIDYNDEQWYNQQDGTVKEYLKAEKEIKDKRRNSKNTIWVKKNNGYTLLTIGE